MPTLLILLALVLVTISPAQDVTPGPLIVQPLSESGLQAQGVRFQRQEGKQEGKILLLSWQGVELPLKNPASNCVCGLSPDGQHLVVLAGGVEESLDLHVIQRGGGVKYPYLTEGGRRLPDSVNGGQGSWPWMEGGDLLLFAYEKEGSLEFRAVDLGGRVFASRSLPATVTAWEVLSNADQGGVRVTFQGAVESKVEPLEFFHPLAPRLEMENSRLSFGTVRLGQWVQQILRLSNTGKRPLNLQVQLSPGAFTLPAEVPKRLQAGQKVELTLRFAPTVAGPQEARLQIQASGVITETQAVLRGHGMSPAPIAKPEVEAEVVDPVTPGDGRPSTEVPPPAIKELAPDSPATLAKAYWQLFPMGSGEVLLQGALSVSRPGLRLLLRQDGDDKVVTCPVDPRGRLQYRIAAKAGDSLSVAYQPPNQTLGQELSWVPVGRVPASLMQENQQILLCGLPNQAFELAQVTMQAGQVQRFLHRWRGRLDSAGRCVLPVNFLAEDLSRSGLEESDLARVTLVLLTEREGQRHRSPPLTLSP